MGDPNCSPPIIGRAIYILQETLPEFFQIGLVSSLDSPVSGRHPLNGSSPPSRVGGLAQRLLLGLTGGGGNGRGNGKWKEKEDDEKGRESIYSPRIRLEYRPPVPLKPLPKTLRVEGLHLYIASSVFIRHTMNALYADLRVDLRRVRVHGPSSNYTGTNGPHPTVSNSKHRSLREKSFFVGFGVTGVGRVSGTPTEWEVNSTYTFSPLTGLIRLHTIDSIEPAPHHAIFEALGRFGLVGGGGRAGGMGGAAR